MPLKVLSHPLVDDAMARLRDKATPCDEFRALARRVSLLLSPRPPATLPLAESFVETPLERTAGEAARRPGGGGAGASRGPRHARRLPRARALGRGGLLRPRAQRGDRGGAALLREGAEGPRAARSPSSSTPCSPPAARPPWPSRACAAWARATSACCRSWPRPRGWPCSSSRRPTRTVYAAALDRGLNEKKYILPGPRRLRRPAVQD